jgi:hypothetical protein
MYSSPQFSSPVKQLMAFLLHSTMQKVNKKDSSFIKIFITLSVLQKLIQLMFKFITSVQFTNVVWDFPCIFSVADEYT